jgi:hypothetical protein
VNRPPSREELLALEGRFPKIRLSFVFKGETRPFFWFAPEGDDLYWGPATAGRFVDLGLNQGSDSITVSIPEEWDDLPEASLKMSYHQSGQVHLKASGRREGDPGQLPRAPDLTQPLHLGGLVTKRADLYPASRKSDERKGGVALRFHIDERSAVRRHFVEFFVSPPGAFTISPPFLRLPFESTLTTATHSISPTSILVARHAVLSADFSQWHPDKEVWFSRFNADQS